MRATLPLQIAFKQTHPPAFFSPGSTGPSKSPGGLGFRQARCAGAENLSVKAHSNPVRRLGPLRCHPCWLTSPSKATKRRQLRGYCLTHGATSFSVSASWALAALSEGTSSRGQPLAGSFAGLHASRVSNFCLALFRSLLQTSDRVSASRASIRPASSVIDAIRWRAQRHMARASVCCHPERAARRHPDSSASSSATHLLAPRFSSPSRRGSAAAAISVSSWFRLLRAWLPARRFPSSSDPLRD